MGNKIVLVENGEILQEESRVAECLYSYFLNVTDALDLDQFFTGTDQSGTVDQKVNRAIEKYKNHDSIFRINKWTKNVRFFGFTHVDPWEVFERIDALDPKKAKSGNIPSTVLKISTKVIFPHLTDCINTLINDCVFPEELKAENVSAAFKSNDSYLKSNYRPNSVLPSVSIIFERIIYSQMQSHFSTPF